MEKDKKSEFSYKLRVDFSNSDSRACSLAIVRLDSYRKFCEHDGIANSPEQTSAYNPDVGFLGYGKLEGSDEQLDDDKNVGDIQIVVNMAEKTITYSDVTDSEKKQVLC